MFTAPSTYSRITNVEEILKVSYRTKYHAAKQLAKWQNNGQVAFSGPDGYIWVTPYRPEIHGILEDAGYHDEGLYVPFSGTTYGRPEKYQKLIELAKTSCKAYTQEEAFKVASEKGIQPVNVDSTLYQVEEFTSYTDPETQIHYTELVMTFLANNSGKNVGTFIVVNDHTLVICDEYGRSFLVTATSSDLIDDLVGKLVNSGYTSTTYPECYVHQPSFF